MPAKPDQQHCPYCGVEVYKPSMHYYAHLQTHLIKRDISTEQIELVKEEMRHWC